MCGIVGSINTTGYPQNINTDVLRHRGPDHQAMVSLSIAGKSIILGHTRLSIIDLSPTGNQPMKSRCGRWHVSYNGEIYNHIEIRKEINIAYKGRSDTETLVECLSKYGIHKTIPKLNGMFAFAALDTIEKKLYLVRDPFGIKPAYFTHRNKSFSFSSEIRGIRAMYPKTQDISTTGLQKYLTLRYIPSPKTIFKGIRRLPPGSILCYDLKKDKYSINTYIKPVSDRFPGTLNEAAAIYLEKIRGAVTRQLLSDVPVGILLSGGIDSALIASIVAETSDNTPCFTVGFGNSYDDCEINDAASTAALLGLKHISVQVTPDNLWAALPEAVQSVEEPLGTTSILPMWYLVKKAREEVTVVLTGQGNDEPWGGYRRYQAEMLRRYLPFPLIYKNLHQIFKNTPYIPEFIERALRSLSFTSKTQRFEEAYALFTASQRNILTGNPGNGNSAGDIERWLEWLKGTKLSAIEQMMRIDTHMNLADDLLLYGDKISMAVSLEARVPMLDLEVIHFVESLPLSYKIKLFRTKIVHRLAAKKYLTSKIVNRPKKGFKVPFGQWIKNEWRDRVEAILLNKNSPYLTHINLDGVMNVWNEHLSGRRDYSRQLFALISLALCVKHNYKMNAIGFKTSPQAKFIDRTKN